MKANTIPDSVHIRKTTRPGNLLGGGGYYVTPDLEEPFLYSLLEIEDCRALCWHFQIRVGRNWKRTALRYFKAGKIIRLVYAII